MIEKILRIVKIVGLIALPFMFISLILVSIVMTLDIHDGGINDIPILRILGMCSALTLFLSTSVVLGSILTMVSAWFYYMLMGFTEDRAGKGIE